MADARLVIEVALVEVVLVGRAPGIWRRSLKGAWS
jgi:hypothetical protein